MPTSKKAAVKKVDPGYGLGIAGFVLFFPGIYIVGLIFSIVGLVKSKKAGFQNVFALVGIILNSLGIVLATIIGAVIFYLVVMHGDSFNESINTSISEDAAYSVLTSIDSYIYDNNTYPQFASDLNTTDIYYSHTDLETKPENPQTIAFFNCGENGNKVGYWDYGMNEPVYLYYGDVNDDTNCKIAASQTY
ncbi:MAG: DUF4190 domain-containing protein [Candidatus Microsaccharimonas sp.]